MAATLFHVEPTPGTINLGGKAAVQANNCLQITSLDSEAWDTGMFFFFFTVDLLGEF